MLRWKSSTVCLGMVIVLMLYGCGSIKNGANKSSLAEATSADRGIPDETVLEESSNERENDTEMETVSAKEEEEILREVTRAAATYQELYQSAEKGNSLNVVIEEKTVHDMADRMAEAGYAVTCDGNDRNMDHWERVDEALKKAKQGEQTSVEFYSIAAYGGLHYYQMEFFEGEMKLTTAEMDWSKDDTPYLSYLDKVTVYSWDYTEKGWLIWEKERSKNMEMDRHSLFRVKPLDDTARKLCETYIEPIGYGMSNLFLTDWSTDDPADLALNDTFGILYYYKNGKNPPYESEVPATEWEEIMTKYLPFSVETLRQKAVFEEQQGTYQWKSWGYGSGMAYPSLPFPEVVSWEQEEDQIWILEVEGVSKEEGMDCAFAHEVTIKIQEDGSPIYLSNRLIPDKKRSVPRYHIRSKK